MARERKSHGVTCNPPGGFAHSSSARRSGWCCCDVGHRLHLGRLGNRRNRKGDGAKRRQHCPRVGLVSYCVDKFQHSADAASNLIELNKVSSWQQSSFIEKGGW